jgi:hypothetical protein
MLGQIRRRYRPQLRISVARRRAGGLWHEFAQKPEALALQSDQEQMHPGHVAAWSVKARHQAGLDRIKAGDKDDGNRRGRSFGRERGGRAERGDHRHIAPDQIGSHGGKPIKLTLRPAIFNGDVAAFEITRLAEAAAEGGHHVCVWLRRGAMEKSDHRQRRLLRARRERPRCRGAAECGQQFPSSDGDRHTPLPCEVRKGKDTTRQACCPNSAAPREGGAT